jgi:N-formylglutamate deformylase
MDERRYERASTFTRLAGDLVAMADELAAVPIEELRPYRAAAE